jgi:hypothetical protein
MRTLDGFAGLSCTAPDLMDAISARRAEEDLGKIPNKKVGGAKSTHNPMPSGEQLEATLRTYTSLQACNHPGVLLCTFTLRHGHALAQWGQPLAALIRPRIHRRIGVWFHTSATGQDKSCVSRLGRALREPNRSPTLADKHVVQPILDGFRSHLGNGDRFQPWPRAFVGPSACERVDMQGVAIIHQPERGGWGRHADAHVQHDLMSPSRWPSMPPSNPGWCG